MDKISLSCKNNFLKGQEQNQSKCLKQDQASILISDSEYKSILFTTSISISGNVDNNEVSFIKNNKNNVKDMIEETIDKVENDDYNKDDHEFHAPQHAIYLFDTNTSSCNQYHNDNINNKPETLEILNKWKTYDIKKLRNMISFKETKDFEK